MFSTQRIEKWISLILMIGALIAVILVMLGGTLYLLQNGFENRQLELLEANQLIPTLGTVLHDAIHFKAAAIIELGLLALVGTQILRAVFLAIYYIVISDYYFSIISLFILLVLVFSFIWRI